MSAPTQILAPTFTCSICRRSFNTLDGPLIIGQSTEARLAKVAQTLADHLGSAHKDHMINITLAGQHYAGWIVTKQYAHNDADLALEELKYGLQLRRSTRPPHVPDEKIEQHVYSRLAAESAETRDSVITMMKEMRDALEQIGKFDPLAPAPVKE